MQTRLPLIIAAAALVGAGCAAAQDSEFEEATPSFRALALDESGGAKEAAARINAGMRRVLGRLEEAIDEMPTVAGDPQAETYVWSHAEDGAEARVTGVRTGRDAFSYRLELKPEGASDRLFRSVLWGSQVPTTGAPHEGKGAATIDFDALRTALPDEQGTGRMTVSYEHRPESRKIVVAAQGYRPDRLSRAFSGRLAQ